CAECALAIAAMVAVRRRLRDTAECTSASDAFRHRVFKRLLEDNPHVAPSPNATVADSYQLPIPMEP
ncbi:MAG: hypothetical protein ACKO5K_00225, partial [Armatimonadota bacterium]